MIAWEIFEVSAPFESDRWAATDRGWLWSQERDASGDCGIALGHYMHYPMHTERTKRYHAVVCAIRGVIGSRAIAWFETAAEARAWIEEQATGQRCLAV